MSQLQLPPYQKQRRSYAGPLGVTNCSSFANVFLQVSAPSMAARNLPEGTGNGLRYLNTNFKHLIKQLIFFSGLRKSSSRSHVSGILFYCYFIRGL